MATDLPFHQAKILIMDDSPSTVKLLEDMLHRAGYTRIRHTTEERQALSVYYDWHPDLVLLDLHMRYLDGFAVMAQLKTVEQDYLPLIVLTGDTSQTVRQRALGAGAKDFLQKPFDLVEALARIRNILEVRLLHKALQAHNALLEAWVQRRTQELNETRLEIVRRLSRAVAYRDNETGLHVIRMSHYAASLGRAVGMSSVGCEILLHACPMHDIGKIGIPDRILLKPARLDPEEWAIMQTHTTIGADLLAGHDSELMQMAHLAALTHHEKWDGSGYPQGLKGAAIPLVGRITAVCDVFDALTSPRPYKRAWPFDNAVAEIQQHSGRHFDPSVVEKFCTILPEIVALQEKYAEPTTAA
jgi:putative two-component system response regulator